MTGVAPIRHALARAALLLALAATPAAAQVQRAFTPRFTTDQPGAITLAGNTTMTCSGNCASTQMVSGGGNMNNDNKTMVYVDVDGDATTFASSRATLTLPAGTTVLWAGLYWGGASSDGARNTVRFAAPGGGYVTVTASQLDAMGAAYQGFADVTAAVAAAGSGSYTIANVRSTPNTGDVWGGWSLIVVYRDDTLLPRNLTVADGFAYVAPGNPVGLTVSGFQTPPTGTVQTSVGVIAYDGDHGFQNESLVLNGTTLSDAQNPANNVYNSTVSLMGTRFSAKTPDYVNQLGFDADLLSANGVLGNGTVSATITLTSAADRYYAGMISFTTDIFLPRFDAASFTKSVSDVNGGAVRPGDVLEYTVTVTNAGTDAALQTVMRDTLATSLVYVAGSLRVAAGANAGVQTDGAGDDVMEYDAATRTIVARLGTGANATGGGRLEIGEGSTVVFRAQVAEPAPTGTVVANQAAVACIGEIMQITVRARSDGDAAVAGAQPTTVTTVSAPMSGRVFEDVNYGGGAGRSFAAASGVARPGARVELYDASGNFRAAAVTDAAGAFAFDGWAPGAWRVRVVNGSVTSSRPGAAPTLMPVQTFRTDATTGTAVAVTDRVGGESPARADAAANLASAPLASLTGGTTTPQSLTAVTLGAAAVGGLDFGFNFSTIVNANDAGQGSLRQFLLNANALGNAGLAQQGHSPGVEMSLFMVSDGAAHPGLRAGLPNLLTAGVVRIPVVTPLPAITGGSTRIEGALQTAFVGNTNPGALVPAGTVGAGGVALPAIAAPEIELYDSAGVAIGIDVQAANVAIGRIAVLGFGDVAGSDAHAAIRIGAGANNAMIEAVALGTRATSAADPGASRRNGGDHVRVVGGDLGTVRGVLAAHGGGSAVTLAGASQNWTIEQCTFEGNGLLGASRAAVSIEASGGTTVQTSRILLQRGPGVDAMTSTGGVQVLELSVSGAGLGGVVTAAVRAGGPSGRVERCELRANVGAGIQVVAGGNAWTLSRNAIAQNGTVAPLSGGGPSGQIGIDLQAAGDNAATGTAPHVSRNDAGDLDGGGNGLVNFPVLESAVIANGTFTITGWSRPGATIELFRSDGDPSGFGEGETWVATQVEGSASDLDAGTSAYVPPVNGLDQGADATRRFRFTGAIPAGLAPGLRLTATGTMAGAGTSEFSGQVVIVTGVTVTGFAYADADHDRQRDAGEAGTGAALWAKLVAIGATAASQVAAVDGTTGAYALTSVNAADWRIVLDTSADPADVAPTYPVDRIGTESPTGVRAVFVNATDVANANFGLWHGSRIAGAVTRDDGAGGGVANDGIAQAGEAPLAGVRVRLASAACAGGACDSTLTDGAGAFELWAPHVAAGAVEVRQVNAAGWISTGGDAGTTGASYDRDGDRFALSLASGGVYQGLGFGDVPPHAWVAPSLRNVLAGGVTFHPHVFTASTDGAVTFAVASLPTPALAGWSATLYRDLDCDGTLDAGEPALSGALPLARGEAVCVLVRHGAPAAATPGATDALTVTAAFAYANAAPALASSSVLADLATVGGGLELSKLVDAATARPGDVLTYTITYSNPGTQPLSSIEIHDTTPAWTTFEAATCDVLGAGLTGCTLAQQPAVGATGSVRWTLNGTLAPGASGSVTFRVRVTNAP